MLDKIPGAHDQPLRAQRLEADTQLHDYQQQAKTMHTDIT